MGQPAARLVDATGHGSPLAPGFGSTRVLIGKKPAWRAVADAHICPLVDGVKPHFSGKVLVGSTTVLIEGFPAARMGDQVVEASAPNPIVTGETTVLIG